MPTMTQSCELPRESARTDGSKIDAFSLHHALLLGEKLFILDVRNPVEFERDRIGSAVNIPLPILANAIPHLQPGSRTILVCEGGTRAAIARRQFGAANEFQVLDGGMAAWRKLQLPVEGGAPAVWSIERQVRVIAGSLVLVGGILTFAVHPAFIIIPAFIGAGLAFSGITNTCGLAMFLARMSWNRKTGATSAPACPAN
ncbi:MAG: rhodanese-like domain-containing protein [Planctomycetes bacterium]|nr:rhodanese-like domain-containing protein [Planctomycetota bacterium]